MLRFTLIFLTGSILLTSCRSSKSATVTQSSNDLQKVQPVSSPSKIHGAGFARLSNYNPDRSFKQAKQNAIVDLEAALLTSVYLEYYGNNTISSRLRAEFAIADDLNEFEYIAIDSLVVGEWAVYFVSEPNATSLPLKTVAKAQNSSWTAPYFEPHMIDGFWIGSGSHPQTRFNPNRGWTKARQEALKNLSEYLNTKVQALERTYDNDYSSVHYVTSKHVFQSIGVIDRLQVDDEYHVLIMIRESDIIRIDEPVSEK